MLDKQKVPLATAPGHFRGDIDVLLCAPDHPGEAVAFELKIIKSGMPALRAGGRPNKLKQFDKAIQQANRLAQLGFGRYISTSLLRSMRGSRTPGSALIRAFHQN